MNIIVTLGEILDSPNVNAWNKYCEKHGCSVWAINAGRVNRNEKIIISVEEARIYGLLENLI